MSTQNEQVKALRRLVSAIRWKDEDSCSNIGDRRDAVTEYRNALKEAKKVLENMQGKE